MSKVWPVQAENIHDSLVLIEPIRDDYRHMGNLTLGVLGIGVEALAGIDFVEGNYREIAAVAFGLFLTGIGYLSDNGGIKSNFEDFHSWTLDKIYRGDEQTAEAADQIDSPPVIV
jgi:hypothetical protein